MTKKIKLEKSFEFEIVDFLKNPVVVDRETEHKGVTIDVETVKEILFYADHIYWVKMGEYETRANPAKSKAAMEEKLSGLPPWEAAALREPLELSYVRKRGTIGPNLHPRPGVKVAAPITPLHFVYGAVELEWKV